MIITIEDSKSSEVFFNGFFYKTNVPVNASVSEALKLSRVFKIKLGYERTPYDPNIFAETKDVAMIADIDTTSGWGNVGLNLIKYSAPYFCTHLIGKIFGVSDASVIVASKRDVRPEMGVIIHEQPKEEWEYLPFSRKIAVVPFETTRVPASWVPRINKCDALIVPCRQNIQMMRDSGVTIPIELVHWGVDTNKFHEIERTKRGVFTFGIMGSLTKRKGIDTLVSAFQKAFPTEKNVRLLCKTSNNFFLWGNKDPRIKIEMTPVSHEELMRDFFGAIDCFVFPTRGEGVGMPPMEAAATGVPVIVTGWSGPVDYMCDEIGWSLDYKLVPATDFTEKVYKEDCGLWAEPSEEHLIKLMRYAYEHPDEVRAKGKTAAKHMRDNWQWTKTIKMYVEAVTKHLS